MCRLARGPDEASHVGLLASEGKIATLPQRSALGGMVCFGSEIHSEPSRSMVPRERLGGSATVRTGQQKSIGDSLDGSTGLESFLGAVKRLRSAVRHVWPGARHDLEDLVRALAASSWSRPWLNALYRQVPLGLTGTFHTRFAKLFRGAVRRPSEGRWDVDFAGRRVSVALRPDTAWLDWDAAMSLLGHEVEIKQTYAALINSGHRPDLFVDIGANYGLHSLLFLVHGIPTLSFEPNPACDRYFRELCALNRVAPSLMPVALGDQEGWSDLWFPESETWLGTIDAGVRSRLVARADLVSCRVRVETLDRHLAELDQRRILMKVDTEGTDIAVLRGARHTLERHRPLVVFESFPGDDRPELYGLLESLQYAVAQLPWSPAQPGRLVAVEEFPESHASNFLAIPLERVGPGGVVHGREKG